MPSTTGGLTTTRDNLFYVSCIKEAAWGTPLAPTQMWRWLDGTDANPDPKFAEEREGDTSPHISLVYKTSQWWVVKVVEYVRPWMIGYTLEALLGAGSDAFVAPTQSSTVSGTITAGANTFNVVAAIGTVGTGYFNFNPGFSNATYEVVNVNLASKTGAGPFTYTLQSPSVFAYGHNAAETISNASTHVFTRQTGMFDAFTIEAAFGSAAFGVFEVFRIQDCICADLQLESTGLNKAIKATHTWYGAPSKIQAALTAISQEGNTTVGAAGGPLTHSMGAWTVDGSALSTTNAATIKSFRLQLKNSVTPEELATENLFAPYYMPGNFDIQGDFTVAFQNYAQFNETYYGSRTVTPGTTTDGLLAGFGSFLVNWTPTTIAGATDGLNSLQLNLPNVAYKAAKMTPKLDGKPVMQQIQIRPSKNTGITPLTVTLLNSNSSSY